MKKFDGVLLLMTAFNDVNGVPGSANTHLLRDVLRKDWKFQGFVVSDWESIKEMTVHGYCRNEKDAALVAARAGVNMEMVSETTRRRVKVNQNWPYPRRSGIYILIKRSLATLP